MEIQTQLEDIQAISHQHQSGEIFAANNLEAARDMCPVLGKLSLEEAGLLLELEAMGKEQIIEQPKQAPEKPVIEKIEKVQSEHRETARVVKPIREAIVSVIEPPAKESAHKIAEPLIEVKATHAVSRQAELGLHALAIQYSEAARIANASERELSEESSASDSVTGVSVEEKQPASRAEDIYLQPETEIIAAVRVHDDQQKIQEVAVTPEHVNRLRNESPSEQPINAKTLLKNEELLQVEDPVSELLLTESVEESISADMAVLAEEQIIEADGSETDYGPFETGEVITIAEILEQSSTENNNEAAFPAAFEISRSGEDEPVEFMQIEPRPGIAIQELPSPLVEVEAAVTELVEVVQIGDAEELKKVDAILGEIITLPAKLEVAAVEEVEELEQKLEGLFVELFEEADVRYSSELIESFVKLTKAHYLEELLAVTKDTEENQNKPAEIGTREFLQKLRQGLSAMRQAVINFYEIGKSIMRLYAYGFEPVSFNFRVT